MPVILALNASSLSIRLFAKKIAVLALLKAVYFKILEVRTGQR